MWQLFLSLRNMKGSHKTGKTSQPEKEQRKKKLSKRSRTMGHIKMKAIVQYTPSEEDISQLLKEFTVDFLLNGTATKHEVIKNGII